MRFLSVFVSVSLFVSGLLLAGSEGGFPLANLVGCGLLLCFAYMQEKTRIL